MHGASGWRSQRIGADHEYQVCADGGLCPVENRTRLEERFDEFKTADGLTLPTRYEIRFAEELQNGRSTLVEWDIAEHAVANDISLDPRNFVVK